MVSCVVAVLGDWKALHDVLVVGRVKGRLGGFLGVQLEVGDLADIGRLCLNDGVKDSSGQSQTLY